MSKATLLTELQTNVYVIAKASPVDGIGVFAVRDIPKGCRNMFAKPSPTDEWIKLTKAEVDQLPQHSKNLVETYCLFDADHYYVPAEGFKKMDLVYFLNHSDTPNIISINEGDYFEAIRDIKCGEELFVDYGEIVED